MLWLRTWSGAVGSGATLTLVGGRVQVTRLPDMPLPGAGEEAARTYLLRPGGATVQLSADGKLLRLSQPTQFGMVDAELYPAARTGAAARNRAERRRSRA
ncbi:hypothetical protein ACFP81_05245 [Deinococcus lacus]|uniref:DUF4115 domain-containing protein n=1 Tax=Deinococcus lacus TaxID=392561 RepID=A0ABW1YB96_9DEIO